MTKKYSSCSYCGSAVDEQHVRIEMWFGDTLVVFEHVPAGVCDHCGEEYFSADIQEKMFALTKTPAKKTLQVPIYTFTDQLTVAKAAAKRKKKDEEKEQELQEKEIRFASDEELSSLMETDLEDWDDL